MTPIPLPDNRVSLSALQALLKQRNLLAALEVFHAELGDIFAIPVPGFNPIMLVGEEANHFLLVEQRGELRWRSEQDPVTHLLQHGVLVEDGDSHDQLRRQMQPALHKQMLEHYVHAMIQGTDAISNQWGNDPVNMLVETRKIALLILMKTLFSVDFAPDMQRLWKTILRCLDYISPGPWVIWRNIPRFGYKGAIRQLDAYLLQLIQMRRQAGVSNDDLLGMLINAGLSDALIRDQLVTLMIAGHDTSTALLSWALYLLASHPEVQARVQQEVDVVIGSQMPTVEHVGQLHALSQVISETLRLYPPIHLGSRVAARDLEFQGHPIPAGRRVLYSIYLTHRDPRYWPDADQFKPERFADVKQGQNPYTYLPFSGGPRNCIGAAFAQVEVKIVIARLLQHFSMTYNGKPVHIHMGATLEPRPALPIKLQRRIR